MFIKAIFAEGFGKIASRTKCYISFYGEVFFVFIYDSPITVFRISSFIQTIITRPSSFIFKVFFHVSFVILKIVNLFFIAFELIQRRK